MSKLRLDEDMDEHGDSYFEDIDTDDLRQLFQHLDEDNFSVGKEEICHFRMKFWLEEGFGQFHQSRIYFHNPIHSSNVDSQVVAEITLKRLELELLMHGGEVTSKLEDATHMIIYASNEHHVSFANIIKSVSNENRNLLLAQSMHVLKHTWLEDAFASKMKPEEDNYSLRERDIDILMTPEKDMVMEKLPQLRKRSSSSFSITGEEMMAETHKSSSKRRLYCAKDHKSRSRSERDVQALEKVGKVTDGGERLKIPGSRLHTTVGSLNETLLNAGESKNELSSGDNVDLTGSKKRTRGPSRRRGRANEDDKVGLSIGEGSSMQCAIFEQEIQKVAQLSSRRRRGRGV